MIGRLAGQKGMDLVAQMIGPWLESSNAQWVILGSGEPEYHQLVSQLAAANPQKIAAQLDFDDRRAHQIEAGADIFLMPSRYEPCGLNQLYSLRYGTVPVVHATGGLADTIMDATPDTLTAGTATGFQFHEYSARALRDVLQKACDTFLNEGATWNRIVTAGMCQDWSWDRSARQYLELYRQTVARLKQTICA
jgi:starch synthase